MNKKLLAVLSVLTFTLIIFGGKADYTKLKASSSEIIKKLMNDSNVAGTAVALVDGQETVWSEGFGYADKEKKIKVTPETLFKLASISKTFTALTVMQLADKKLLDIDVPIQKYIPDFSINDTFKDSGAITLRNIMTHHSGLPEELSKNWKSTTPFEEVVKMYKNEYRAYPANYIFNYSNSAMSLLAVAVQNVTKTKFTDYTYKNIFLPMGMKNSGYGMREDMKKMYTKTYDEKGNPAEDYTSMHIASGSVVSSVNDMTKYIKMYLADGKVNGKQVVSRKALEEMMTVQNKDNKLDSDKIGLTWLIYEDQEMGKLLIYQGATDLFHTSIVISPKMKLGMVMLTNSRKGSYVLNSAMDIFVQACQIKSGKSNIQNTGEAVPEQKTEEPKLTTAEASPEELIKYTGYYVTSEGLCEVKNIKNGFEISMNGMAFNFIKMSDGNFYAPNGFILTIEPGNNRNTLLISSPTGFSMLANKLTVKSDEKVWMPRNGRYECEKNGLAKAMTINVKEGFIQVLLELNMGNLSVVKLLIPETDNFGRFSTTGIPNGYGEAVGFIKEKNEEYIYYSGSKFIKVK